KAVLVASEKRLVPEFPKDYQGQIKEPSYIKEKFKEISTILGQVVLEKLQPDSLTDRIDRYALHPFWGLVLMFAILIFIFQLLFSWADPLMEGIEWVFALMSEGIESVVPEGHLRSFL